VCLFYYKPDVSDVISQENKVLLYVFLKIAHTFQALADLLSHF